MDPAASNWWDENNRYLAAAIGWVRARLQSRAGESHFSRSATPAARRSFRDWFLLSRSDRMEREPRAGSLGSACNQPGVRSNQPATDEMWSQMATIRDRLATANLPVPALEQMRSRLALSDFEYQTVLLCLACELDSHSARLCGHLQPDAAHRWASFGVAMVLFDDPAWSAIPAEGKLRRWRLLHFVDDGRSLLTSPLRVAERVLHFAKGVGLLDEQVRRSIRWCAQNCAVEHIGDRLRLQAEQVATLCAATTQRNCPTIQLLGTHLPSIKAVAHLASQSLGLSMAEFGPAGVPTSFAEVDELANLWERESRLLGLSLFIDASATAATAASEDPQRHALWQRFVHGVTGPVFVAVGDTRLASEAADVDFEVSAPSTVERRQEWLSVLPEWMPGREQLAGELSHQFRLECADILAVLPREWTNSTARGPAPDAERFEPGRSGGDEQQSPTQAELVCPSIHSRRDVVRRQLWHACCLRSRPALDGLAQRIELRSTWDDLVVSEECRAQLRQVIKQVCNRWRVYDDWGLGGLLNRGLGVVTLFAGASGTGKTMAAEALAQELQLDLYRVDLSAVVNKYVGETEKHLRRLFAAGSAGGAILLFDECDALFGKRGEVRDSQDNFANIGISYALQGLETFAGIAVLATNRPGAIDPPFRRRFRSVINFGPPTAAQRLLIWRNLLQGGAAARAKNLADVPRPSLAPIDFERLAQFELNGGHILNAVLCAASCASDRDEAPQIMMSDVLSAVQAEYVKLGRPIDAADFALTTLLRGRVVA